MRSTLILVVAPTVALGLGAGIVDAGTIPAPSDDGVVIQFTTGGGRSGPCCTFWDLPEITVYADGRAVLTEYGGGQLPEMTEAMLDWQDVETVLGAARDAGLLGGVPPDTGALCCDLAYTRVLLVDGESSAEFQVMGLGFEGETTELTAAQLQVRRELDGLQSRLRSMVSEDDDAVGYVPAELALLAAPPRDEPVAEPQEWPLDEPLADGLLVGPGEARCVSVTGIDAQVVLDAVEAAESAEWTSHGEDWTVFVRPLLSHEHGCPEGDPWAVERTELADRRTQWILSGAMDDYQFVVTAHCFCPTEFTTPRTITVEHGDVVAVEPELPAGFTMPLTVEDLFDLVEQGFDEGERVDVSYDETYGFPTIIFIDWDTAITDEESAYEVTDFRTTS